MTHETSVHLHKSTRNWHVWCDTCNTWVSHYMGHRDETTAAIVAIRHSVTDKVTQ